MNALHYILVFLTVALVAASTIPTNYLGAQVVEERRYPGVGLEVDYLRPSYLSRPEITVSFPALSPSDGVVVEAFGLLPNGSVKKLGRFTGSGAVVKLDRASLAEISTAWAEHVESKGITPEDIGIGLTLLTTVLKPDGVYTIASVVPLRLSSLLKGYSVRMTISSKPIKVMDYDTPLLKAGAATSSERAAQSSPLPPGEIEDGCITYPGYPYPTKECYYWEYELGEDGNAVYVGFDVPIPLVATVVKSSAYSKIRDVYLHEFLKAKESESISVGITTVAGISTSGSSSGISYEVIGFSWEGYSSTVADLEFSKWFTPGEEFSGPSILYVGFRGDISIAPYRLYKCIYSFVEICEPLNKWANITYVRPVGGGPLTNDTGVWSAVSLYNYNNPVVRAYLDLVIYGWLNYENMRETTDNVTVTSWIVEHEVNTIPLFSGSFDALSLITSEVTSSLAPIMSVSIGINVQREAVEAMDLISTTKLKAEEVVHWEYAKSPVTYGYGGSTYKMGMVYVRITG